mmetsp:Transcript_13633/g.30992  ORF Transcript_13633/g.30992 Transcript_13633/m.30992 type:complete len:203 (-) Transcript_13633:3268-3876(-)
MVTTLNSKSSAKTERRSHAGPPLMGSTGSTFLVYTASRVWATLSTDRPPRRFRARRSVRPPWSRCLAHVGQGAGPCPRRRSRTLHSHHQPHLLRTGVLTRHRLSSSTRGHHNLICRCQLLHRLLCQLCNRCHSPSSSARFLRRGGMPGRWSGTTLVCTCSASMMMRMSSHRHLSAESHLNQGTSATCARGNTKRQCRPWVAP